MEPSLSPRLSPFRRVGERGRSVGPLLRGSPALSRKDLSIRSVVRGEDGAAGHFLNQFRRPDLFGFEGQLVSKRINHHNLDVLHHQDVRSTSRERDSGRACNFRHEERFGFVDGACSSLLPFHLRQRLSRVRSSAADGGTRVSLTAIERQESIVLTEIYSELLSEARECDDRLGRVRRVLVATDCVLSEVVRLVMGHCMERGALLQLLREEMVGLCNGLIPPREEIPRDLDVGDADGRASALRAEMTTLEAGLLASQCEVEVLRAENARLSHLNGLLTAQRAHEAVLQRAVSLGASCDGLINRAMVLDAASKAALSLKKVKCEAIGEIDGFLRLKARDDLRTVGTQTSDADIIGSLLGGVAVPSISSPQRPWVRAAAQSPANSSRHRSTSSAPHGRSNVVVIPKPPQNL